MFIPHIDIMPLIYGFGIFLFIVGVISHYGIKGVFALIAVGAVALFLYAKDENEKQDKQRAADYVAERAWKDPIIQNCENAVRGMADAATLKFGGMLGYSSGDVEKTDSGYLYRLSASDATTENKSVTMLCYTNINGNVVRVVPKEH